MIKQKLLTAGCLLAATGLLTLALQGSASAEWTPVPELDPQTAGAGLAVLGGAAAMLLERYRRRRS